MLEWLWDDAINRNFWFPFCEMTIEKVQAFIEHSFDEEDQYFAITNEQDEYLETISLKNISQKNHNAEYAIVIRKIAQGTGAAMGATEELQRCAFEELGLHKIYLNVLEQNKRARRFYEKCGFELEGISKESVRIRGQHENLVWYGNLKGKEQGE